MTMKIRWQRKRWQKAGIYGLLGGIGGGLGAWLAVPRALYGLRPLE